MLKNLINIYTSFSQKRIIETIFLCTFTFGLLFLFYDYSPNFINEGDNLQYLTFAEEIIKQGFFVENITLNNLTAGWWGMLGPGYPLIIALSLSVFGSTFIPIFIFNALFVSLAVIIYYKLTWLVSDNKNISIIVSIWAILNYNFYKYIPFLLKESLVYALLPLTLYFIIKESNIKQRISYNIILAIIVFTYLIHTDERYFTYFLILIIPFLLYDFKKKLIAKKISIWIIGVIILMIPWLIRNYAVYNQVVILTERTTKITSLFWGKDLTLSWNEHRNQEIIELELESVIDSIRSGYYPKSITQQTFKNIKWGLDNDLEPRKFSSSEKYLKASLNFWQPLYISPTYIGNGLRPQLWSWKHNLTSLICYGLFLPFYFLGMLSLIFKIKNRLLLFIGTIPIVQMLIHVALVHVIERYRAPVDGFIIIIAIWYINELYKSKYISKVIMSKVKSNKDINAVK